MELYDVVIVGAGAAGMMCAIEAGKRGRRVLLIDHAKAAGQKIRISGGGRCNFTNLDISHEKFLSKNPRFAASALARYSQWDFIDWIVRNKIPYHEKTLGQLFCDESAQDILDMLHQELNRYSVNVLLKTEVLSVRKEGKFSIQITSGTIQCESLIVATGGKSIPKMGATSWGYDLADQFQIAQTETRPALVPLTFAHQELGPIKAMSGTSVQAKVSCSAISFDEGLLFTHRGLSGPSILQISSYWHDGDELSVNLHAASDVLKALRDQRQTYGRQAIHNALAKILPSAVAAFCVERAELTGNLADQSDAKLVKLAEAVHSWKIKPVGSEGYRTAEVTLGGIETDELNAKTMESKKVQGLYFIGEVVDVTGWLGGYNFQWAWSSGWAAGQVA